MRRERMRTGWAGWSALSFLLLVVLLGLVGPVLSPWSATATDLTAVRSGPSAAHWLGTDQLGRDELTRLLVAARTSALIVTLVIGLSLPLGAALGLIAGWRGGLLDTIVLRVTDVTTALPALLVALVLTAVLGGGLLDVVLALVAGGWAAYARLLRTEVRLLRDSPAVQSLLLLGAGPGRVLVRHVLPAVLGSVLVLASTDVAAIVLAISTLTFLGLGVPPPTPEWGSMIVEARPYLTTEPRLFLLPMLVLGLVVLAVNVLAEGAGRWVTHGGGTARPHRRTEVVPRRSGGGPHPLLAVRDLSIDLTGPAGPRRVVGPLDLTVHRGELVAVVGASGSGKSLTAGALVGLLPEGMGASLRGSVRLAGDELLGRPDAELRRVRGARIGLVPQDLAGALDPMRRVGAQVGQAARMHRGASRRQAAARAHELLAWVGFADVDRTSRARPGALSGGMRQRALVAAALAGDPQLLVADEPTSALDAPVARQLLDVLARARDERGTAVLLVTHDLGLVASWADTLVVVDAGRVVESGPVDRLLARPTHPVTRALRDAARPTRPTVRPVRTRTPLLLQARDLDVRYAGRRRAGRDATRALTGVSLDVRAGGGLGVVGESGSGKSTLARVLVGLQRPAAGTVTLAGWSPEPGDGRAQLVFQDPSAALDRRQPVGAALAEALLLGRRRGHVPGGASPESEVLSLLDRVGLAPEHADRRPWQLSGGQRQRVVIARALAARPELLVLDEPVSSLDAVVRAGVLELLRSVRDDGVALVVVSHDLTAVEALTDDLLVLSAGVVVEQGPTARLLHAPAHPVAVALLTPDPTDPDRGAVPLERKEIDV